MNTQNNGNKDPVQVFGQGGTNDVRANRVRNEMAGSENMSHGHMEDNGEGAKGLPVIGQQSTLITNNAPMPRSGYNKPMNGTARSLSVVPSGMRGGQSRKAIREGIDMLEAKFL